MKDIIFLSGSALIMLVLCWFNPAFMEWRRKRREAMEELRRAALPQRCAHGVLRADWCTACDEPAPRAPQAVGGAAMGHHARCVNQDKRFEHMWCDGECITSDTYRVPECDCLNLHGAMSCGDLGGSPTMTCTLREGHGGKHMACGHKTHRLQEWPKVVPKNTGSVAAAAERAFLMDWAKSSMSPRYPSKCSRCGGPTLKPSFTLCRPCWYADQPLGAGSDRVAEFKALAERMGIKVVDVDIRMGAHDNGFTLELRGWLQTRSIPTPSDGYRGLK